MNVLDKRTPQLGALLTRAWAPSDNGHDKPSVLHSAHEAYIAREQPLDRFHALFEQFSTGSSSGSRAHDVAIECDGQTCTFGELDALANRIARHLLSNGIKAGDVVALLLDRSICSFACVLAVSKIECVFVPLDLSFPDTRISFICSDSNATFALTSSAQSHRFSDANVEVIALDKAEEEISKRPSRPPLVVSTRLATEALCYIIYTSGTTGNPKGVPITHANIVNFLRVAVDAYGFQSDDRVFQSLTFAFDYSFEEIWVPLLSGACLVPAPAGVSLLGPDLHQFLNSKQITAWCSVPTVLSTIDEPLPDLRLLLLSGESCPQNLVDRWCTPQRRVLNLYGPTETTVSATWKVLRADQPVTIGIPLATYTVLILSPDRPEVVASGTEGEIALAGPGLATGYLNRVAETEKAFIADFLSLENNPGGQIYRTGDLGLINQYGEIEYRGRVDTQVKIRGYRIELDEIESVARTVSGLGDIVVNPVKSTAGDIELAAYFTTPQGLPPVDVESMRAALSESLPHYMVPAYFEALEKIPLLPSQKVDRKSLPLPSQPRLVDESGEYILPKEGLEAELADLLASMLEINRVSADADFFIDLGANSLSMARYLGSVRKQLKLRSLSIKLIYQNSTIQKLAAAVQSSTMQCTYDRDVVPVLKPVEQPGRAGWVDDTPPLDSYLSDKPCDSVQVNGRTAGNDPQHVVPTARYVACGIAQMLWLVSNTFIAVLTLLVAFNWITGGEGPLAFYGRAVLAGAAFFAGTALYLIAIKWMVVGKFKRGVIPLWGIGYLRFWIAQSAIRSNPLNVFVGTPLYNVYLRLLGMRVGRGALIFAPAPTCTDLITIGENALVRQDSVFTGYMARKGRLHLGTVDIGSRTYIGEATVLDINSAIGDDAQLGNRSGLHENQKVAGEKIYLGSPAEVGTTDFVRVPDMGRRDTAALVYTAWRALSILLLIFPATALVAYFIVDRLFGGFAVTDGGSAAGFGRDLIVLYGIAIYFGGVVAALIGVVVMPRLFNLFFVPEKAHGLFGIQYVLASYIRQWSNSRLLQTFFGDSSLIVPFYKAIGYDLSKTTQNGSNFGIEQRHHSPFLCTFNRNTLVSDGLVILNLDMGPTSFRASRIAFPEDVYLGNDLHYPSGARIGSGCLVATKALVPIDGPVRTDVGILGSPPFEIPRGRKEDVQHDYLNQPGMLEKQLRLKLSSNLVTLGLFIFRNCSALILAMLFAHLIYEMFGGFMGRSSVHAAGIVALSSFVLLISTCFYFIAYERIANWYRPMKPRICSLYDSAFWDHERFWKLNLNPALDAFSGTPLKSYFLRCQGVKLGKQVFDNGVAISEPHMVRIGDFACLNRNSTVQGHSLEDGTFKSGEIIIGDRCTLGVSVFVHYSAEIGDDVDIKTDAFVMKGSILAGGETWVGNPAHQVDSPEISPNTRQNHEMSRASEVAAKNVVAEMA